MPPVINLKEKPMTWFAQAPANIALIKYMGKENEHTNSPANPSLSYTLPHLLSHVTLDQHEASSAVSNLNRFVNVTRFGMFAVC